MRLDKKTAEHLRSVFDLYADSINATKADVAEAVAWGLKKRKLDLSAAQKRELLQRMMSEALRDDVVEYQGHKMRARICVRVKTKGDDGKELQRDIWGHAAEADDEFFIEGIRQHWQHCRARAHTERRQCELQLAYLNERRQREGKRPIQMEFDFDEEEPDQESQAS